MKKSIFFLISGKFNHQRNCTSHRISFPIFSKALALTASILCNSNVIAGQVIVVNVDEQTNVSWKKPTTDSAVIVREKNTLQDFKLRQRSLSSNGTAIPIDDNNDVNKLGNGYDSIKEKSKGASSVYVTSEGGTVALVGNTEAQFSVGVDLTHKAILDNISGGASADLKFSAVDVSGNIAIANQSAADSYVGTYILFARVKPEKTVLLSTPVSEDGVSANNLAGTGVGLIPTNDFLGWQSVLGNGQPLMNKVGDEFIHAIEYGSWLMVTLKFEYKNAKDKKDIGGQLSVNWAGGIDANGSADFSSIENANTVSVTISAEQYGGDSQNLVDVIPNRLLSCTLSNPTACFELFENTVNYMKTDYPSQFKNTEGSLNLNKFNPIRYFTARYDQSGPQWTQYINDPYDDLSFASRQALREVHSRWERALLDKRRANYLLDERFSELNASQQNTITTIANLSRGNANNLASLVNDCLQNAPDYCERTWAAQTFFNSYDETALEF